MKHPVIIVLLTLLATFPIGGAAQNAPLGTDALVGNTLGRGRDGAVLGPRRAKSPYSVFGFEPLAVKREGLLSLAAKEEAVDAVIEALKLAIDSEPGVETAVGTNGLDRLTYREDDDRDGISDEAGRMLEVLFTDGGFSDHLLLRLSGRHHLVAMPLGILGVLTHDVGDATQIQVYGVQPETYVRVFWRDQEQRELLEALAAINGNRLATLAREALQAEGFSACGDGGECSSMGKGPILPDPVIGVMETMARLLTGDPSFSLSDYDHVAPAVAVGSTSIESVLAIIEARVGAGTRGDIGETELADAFASATGGDFDAVNAILERALEEIWGKHKALVDWVLLRSLLIDSEAALVEVCQPFYATTALGAPTFNHFLALPCGYGVWRTGEEVNMSVLNPMAVFSTLFNDGMLEVCASTNRDDITLCRLFMKFPMIVFNDVAAVMNGVLEQLGVADRIPLYEISGFKGL